MSKLDEADFAAPQREVQRLLGRCLIRIQQCERLLKAMIAFQEISGTPQTMERVRDQRVAEAGDKTLGTLVGRLFGSYVLREGAEAVDEEIPDLPGEAIHFSFRSRLTLHDCAYEKLKADLREFVSIRNTLVHHFIEQHDLWTLDGCLQAQDALIQTYSDIDRNFAQLHTMAEQMDEARVAAAELMGTPEFRDQLINGVNPDGTVCWPMAGIVSALREACDELSIDGWTNLDAAARWVSEHRADQTPQKYGCARWRHVIHASQQFELRRTTHNDQFGTWFRPRPPTSD